MTYTNYALIKSLIQEWGEKNQKRFCDALSMGAKLDDLNYMHIQDQKLEKELNDSLLSCVQSWYKENHKDNEEMLKFWEIKK